MLCFTSAGRMLCVLVLVDKNEKTVQYGTLWGSGVGTRGLNISGAACFVGFLAGGLLPRGIWGWGVIICYNLSIFIHV